MQAVQDAENRGETPYLPGAAAIVEHLDKKLLLILQDGRNLIGLLRTFDQYLNLVLENTVERVIFEGKPDRFRQDFQCPPSYII